MVAGKPEMLEGCTVGAKLVGRHPRRREPLLAEQLAHQLDGRSPVSTTLDQDLKDLAFVVDGTPQIHVLARHPDDHFVEMCTPAAFGMGATDRTTSAPHRIKSGRLSIDLLLFDPSQPRLGEPCGCQRPPAVTVPQCIAENASLSCVPRIRSRVSRAVRAGAATRPDGGRGARPVAALAKVTAESDALGAEESFEPPVPSYGQKLVTA
jgi:hypothetical protein